MFLQNLPSRPRRNRRSETFRSGIRENWLSPSHFILPIFVHESDKNEPIQSMPGIERLAYGKNVLDHVAQARSLGVNQVVIFPKVCLATAAGLCCHHYSLACASQSTSRTASICLYAYILQSALSMCYIMLRNRAGSCSSSVV